MRFSFLLFVLVAAGCRPVPVKAAAGETEQASPPPSGCAPGERVCGGLCVDITSSTAHCGGCDNACAAANATSSCVLGACAIAQCAQGFGDCDGLAQNGCEADLLFDADRCGACGNVCPAVAAGHDRSCEASVCGAVCKSGLILCGGECKASCDDWKFVNPNVVGANSLFAIAFKNAQTGVAAGVKSILRTTNGGANWTPVTPVLLDYVEAMAYTADRLVAVGWSISDPVNGGAQSAVILSADDGATWTTVPVSVVANEMLRDVSFDGAVGAAVGIGTGTDGFLVLTTNSGASWTRATVPAGTKWLHGVHRRGAVIWAAGDSGVLRSTNSGQTFTQVLAEPMNSVHFTSASLGLAVGPQERIYRTVDGGVTWTQVHGDGPANDWLRRVRFSSDGLHAAAVGFQGNSLLTSDGGLTWTRSNPYKLTYLFDVAFSGTTLWSAGTRGVIFRSDDFGSSWTRQIEGYTATMYRTHFPDGVKGFAVGELGGVLGSNDSGRSWFLVKGQHDGYADAYIPPAATQNTLRSVYFIDALAGWAVGEPVTDANKTVLGNSVILHTINGGQSWTEQNSGVTGALRGVAFVDKLKGYAVGAGVILRTVDGGANWLASSNSFSLNDVAVLSPTVAVAVGNFGALLRTEDSGLTWTPLQSGMGTLFTVRSLGNGAAIFSGSTFSHTVGFSRTADEGKTWTRVATVIPGMALSVAFNADGLRGVATTESGRILRSKDGGATWKVDAFPSYSMLNDAQSVSGGFIVAGEFGGILRGPLDSPRQ